MGLYFGVEAGRLRLITGEGEVILTPAERAEQERLRAEVAERQAQAESLRAEQQRERAERLAQRLREQGLKPDAL
ncbi:MAG: hypothetical protein KME03_11085 [Aphanocapsa lilacina HA4352-LM1]|nr:hypothetical protein [Aphanocapsa lilacina HA4352-LM1]